VSGQLQTKEPHGSNQIEEWAGFGTGLNMMEYRYTPNSAIDITPIVQSIVCYFTD